MGRSSRATRQVTRQLDDSLRVFHTVPKLPSEGWISAIRDALGMTREQLAKRLGISRVSAYRVENDETTGRMTIARLQRIAETLDCELVYALVPRTSLADTVKKQAIKQVQRKLNRVNASQALEDSALSNEALSRQVDDLVAELTINRSSTLWDD